MQPSATSSGRQRVHEGAVEGAARVGNVQHDEVIATPAAVKSPIVQSTAPRTTRERSERRRLLLAADAVAEAAHRLDRARPRACAAAARRTPRRCSSRGRIRARRCAPCSSPCETTRPRWCIRYESTRNSWPVSFTGLPSTRHPREPRVEHERPGAQLGVSLPARAADERPQAREHLLDPERLGDVVVRAAVDALDLLVPAAARGEDQHGHREPGLAPTPQHASARRAWAGRGRAPPRRRSRSGRGTRPRHRRSRGRRRSPPRRAPRPAARPGPPRLRRPGSATPSYSADPAERHLNAPFKGRSAPAA